MGKKIKVFIVDDHNMFREGVKILLNNSNILEITGEAQNGKEFLETFENSSHDVILMDIAMPIIDGIEATKLALQKNPSLKIIALSMFGDEGYYYKMIQAGVKGFVLKSSGIIELEKAINEVSNGEYYFSSDLIRKVIVNLDKEKSKEKQSKENPLLSNREIQIVKEISLGLSNEEIAEKLHISLATVKTHRTNLLSKTNCSNTASLIMFAIKNKIIEV